MSDSSDDEDVPLGLLVAKKTSASAPAPKKRKPEPVVASSKKKAAPKPKAASEPAPRAKAAKLTNETDLFFETLKGQLIQKLLCRWWYAIKWPSEADLSKPVPAGYEQLEGFPGVYISTKGDDVGKIIDNRCAKTCPNYQNLKKKNSEELRDLLKKALEKQNEQLIEHEGPSSSYAKSIAKELQWVNKLNPAKADKEAAKAGF